MTLLLIVATSLVLLSLIGWTYLQHPKFGPKLGDSCSKVEHASLHCTDGMFQNFEPTTVLAGDNTTASIILHGILNNPENLRPDIRIPTQKTDLKSLDSHQDLVIWLGHSSYFVQLGGRRILIDPVFSRYASPIPFANEAFEGTSIYSADDIPDIDYLLITHDHWDHLDYSSIHALRDKVRHVVCGFGVDQYFLHWGYADEIVHAAGWFTSLTLESGFTIHIVPARHYSGRMFSKTEPCGSGSPWRQPDGGCCLVATADMVNISQKSANDSRISTLRCWTWVSTTAAGVIFT